MHFGRFAAAQRRRRPGLSRFPKPRSREFCRGKVGPGREQPSRRAPYSRSEAKNAPISASHSSRSTPRPIVVFGWKTSSL